MAQYNVNQSSIVDAATVMQPTLLKYRLPVETVGDYYQKIGSAGIVAKARQRGADSSADARFSAVQKQALPVPNTSLFLRK